MTCVAAFGGRQTRYDEIGDPGAPALVLVSGIGGHLLGWPTELCEQLAAQGLRVVRFDLRDTGFATRTPTPPPRPLPDGSLDAAAPYGLRDLAADMVGLMDVLGIERAHAAGISFGGMVVQRLAIDRPDRVASLIPIMTSTGSPDVGGSTPEAIDPIMRPTDGTLDAVTANALEFARVCGGPFVDEDLLRRLTAASYERAYHPDAKAYHYAAFVADGDRTAELATVQAPTLVIHGHADRLIDISGGRAIAASIPGADLVEMAELGHSLAVPGLWGRLVDLISAQVLAAEAAAPS
ncbi:alpha/beta fold hydrolase [Pimelobacter sp. 30-1]|uniref:alpha/beta fold hydrolase n=1 Tax=Pimelobacter sp. 30-1 TaxID=2004991 RepID=UPI001C03B359|nr:alpha/beta fold hydrolase [Pimelobacter sp. 30-1]MBU2694372.1 hypothetical protein [Pimelobacter sp. 30-1]